MKQSSVKTVLCLDIDGTLTDRQGKIHPGDAAILNNFPGSIQPIFATGRSLSSARGVLREYGIFPTGLFPHPGVFLNGGVALLPGEQPVVEQFLPHDLREEFIRLSNAFPNTTFTFFSITEVFLINPTPFGWLISERDYLSAKETAHSNIPDLIVKVMVIEEDLEIIAKIKDLTRHLQAEMGTSLPYLFEVNAPGINKARTLSQLLHLMGLEQVPIYAAGDGENDLAMMEITERFFAPITANEHVRNQATRIIDPQKEGILAPILAEIS